MKHFIVLIKYKVPIDEIIKVQDVHRSILQQGIESGVVLMSGPMEPRTGGLVILKSDSIESANRLFAEDPYYKNDLAEYNFYEFSPGKHQSFLSDWINN